MDAKAIRNLYAGWRERHARPALKPIIDNEIKGGHSLAPPLARTFFLLVA